MYREYEELCAEGMETIECIKKCLLSEYTYTGCISETLARQQYITEHLQKALGMCHFKGCARCNTKDHSWADCKSHKNEE